MKKKMITVVLSLIVTDKFRLANVEHMLESIRAQTRLPDALFVDIYCAVPNVDMKHLFRHPLCINKDKLKIRKHSHERSRFFYMSSVRIPQDSWVLFSQDDGIWHPKRVEFFYTYCRQADPDCSMVASPAKTYFLKDVTRPIHTTHHVDDAVALGDIKIEPWFPDHEAETVRVHSLDLYEICVRAFVLKEFFSKVEETVLHNAYCDVEFADFAASYPNYKTLYIHPNHWLFMWRRAEDGYIHVDGSQLPHTKHGARNAYDIVPYMHVIAEMDDCPSMKSTARTMLVSLTEPVEEHERCMLVNECRLASMEKKWIKK